MKQIAIVLAAVAAIGWVVLGPLGTSTRAANPSPTSLQEVPETIRRQLAASYGKLPLSFEPNQGQLDQQVHFLARGNGYSLFLTDAEAVLSLRRSQDAEATAQDVVRLQMVGTHPDPQVTGENEQPGRSNYLVGNDPARWHTDLPRYGKVRYH